MRRSQQGTDDFPLKGAIAAVLLIGLVTMAPGLFSGFFHSVLNRGFSGIKGEPSCFITCGENSIQGKDRAVVIKRYETLPLAGACEQGAPALPGQTKPATATCENAKKLCASKSALSDAALICKNKGWKIHSGIKLPPVGESPTPGNTSTKKE